MTTISGSNSIPVDYSAYTAPTSATGSTDPGNTLEDSTGSNNASRASGWADDSSFEATNARSAASSLLGITSAYGATPMVNSALTPVEASTAISTNQRLMENAMSNWADRSHVTSADRNLSATEWKEKFQGANQFSGMGGVDALTQQQLDRSVENATNQEISDAANHWVDRYSAPGMPFADYSEAQRAQLKEGVKDFLTERRAFAGVNNFSPAAEPALATPGTGAPIDQAALDRWESTARSDVAELFRGSGVNPSDNSTAKHLDRNQQDLISTSREVYEAAMQNIEELPTDSNIRADYIQHLENNPGDIAGAYKVIEDRLNSRMGNRIADEVNSMPDAQSIWDAMNPFNWGSP